MEYSFIKKIVQVCYLCLKMVYRKMSLKSLTSIKVKYVLCFVFLFSCMNYFGCFTHFFERDYFTEFTYPLEGDITKYVEQFKNEGFSDKSPINIYNYTFVSDCHLKCKDGTDFTELRLVYIVKSAMPNFDRRQAIRKSWGFERRFSDVSIRTLFIVGINPTNITLQSLLIEEQEEYGDIVQANFVDTYYNNTIKTMMGIKWAKKFCPNSKFYFFSDDDMYVSTKNALRFIRNPTRYPSYLEDPVISLTKKSEDGSRQIQQVLDFELPDEVQLYAGHVMFVAPLRHRSSKWYVPLEEYPYHMWPPYVTAGAYILSKAALDQLFFGSLFTKHFRFDDIYLALVAYKTGLEPLHCPEFRFDRPTSNHPSNYHYVIASHGFSDPTELSKFWEIQRESGNA